MGNNFVCPRCHNKNPMYVGYRNGKPYCRFCISMNGKGASSKIKTGGPVRFKSNYKLSKEQSAISIKLLSNYLRKVDTLVNAVCGAGKTEIVYGLIGYCLSKGKTVAFAVPRRDVVIELSSRIRGVFPEKRTVSVYGGHTDNLEGDIVVLTTHQLYRYKKYFDLIILDEIDAFPFKNNRLLKSMFYRAIKGPLIVMSATPSLDVIEFFQREGKEILELNTRFHKHPLPVPKIEKRFWISKLPFLIRQMKFYISQNKKVFVFASTIRKCEILSKFLQIFIKNGTFVHSKCKDRNKKISAFKNGKYDYLVTTAVLERGVTFRGLQVIIYDADSNIYNSETLIQIAGRVGRKNDSPEGEVIYLVNKVTSEITKSIETIKSKNRDLQNMLSTNNAE